MKLKEKREIVERFKAGEDIYEICLDMHGAGEFIAVGDTGPYEDVIRDFLTGKFTLEPKGRRKG